MAAGLGFKDFTTGEVLTAADVDGYLMQGVWVFASAAARDAAVTSPQEGNFAYLKDTNVTTYYTGSAWANLDTTGMTNPMTTTGDIIYSSPGSTPVRLGIGTANQVLTVNSGATAPEWKTPSAGATYKGVSLYQSGAGTQTISNSTDTVLTFDSEFWDTDGFHSTSSNTSRITIPVGLAGKYLISCKVLWELNATGERVLNLLKNGSQEVYAPGVVPSSTVYVGNHMCIVLNLAEGDYIEMQVFQNSGGNRTAYKRQPDTPFSATYLGA